MAASQADGGDLARISKSVGEGALKFGKKALESGRSSVTEAHEAGMFRVSNLAKFNSDLVHIVGTVKGDVERTSRGEITASQVSAPSPASCKLRGP